MIIVYKIKLKEIELKFYILKDIKVDIKFIIV